MNEENCGGWHEPKNMSPNVHKVSNLYCTLPKASQSSVIHYTNDSMFTHAQSVKKQSLFSDDDNDLASSIWV